MKYISLVIIIVLVSCQLQPEKNNNNKTIELLKLEESIDSLFNAKIGANEPGAAVLVSYDGKMIFGKGYGLRDLENKQPITINTNMRTGSVGKQFTALTILSLVDNGQLSLSDTAYSIFPYESFKNVTIEQLINHTSGLSNAREFFFTEWDSTIIAENKDVLEWYSKEDRIVTKPGEKFQYNDAVYDIIPSIVEKLSGKEFSDFAKENVFEKAGMKNTNFFNLAKPIEIKERAYCYEKDSLGNWNKVDGHFLNGILGSGGVYTSVNDYFQYDLALRDKTIFSESTHALIFKPSSKRKQNGVELDYAMGWNVTDSTATHGGWWYGAKAHTKRYLNKPLTIAIFMNRNLRKSGLNRMTDSLVYEYVKTTTANKVQNVNSR